MMIIDAYPSERIMFRTKPVYQYDYGHIIKIHLSSLPATYKVEFSNSTRADAVPTVQTSDEVIIPAQFLRSGSPIYAWIVVVDETSRTTEYVLVVPVIARAKPTDTEPTPEEQSEIEQALSALNGAVENVQEIAEAIPSAIDTALAEAKASGEFDGPQGPQGETGATGQTGPQGEPGQDGTDGVSPAVAITSITGGHEVTITDAEHPSGQRFNVMDGAQGPAGTDGQDGTDGISPEITVESITGGHRITITDADHPQGQSVDVMDGVNGSDGRGIVSITKTGTSGLVDTYTITYTTGSPTTFTVTNGADGVNAYVHIKYAQQQPTQDSDMNGTPGPWMGVYSGTSATAPAHHTDYAWNEVKGPAGVDGVGVPIGGTTGQVLTKSSGTDYDTQWTDKNPVVQVSGTTPTINAVDGTRYVCGEVATLDVVLPESGIVDVIFQSGSTATVLTVTPPTGKTLSWANGFDPTALDADTTYEINIMDGLGVAVGWT